MAEVTQPTTAAAPTAQASTPTPTSAAPASPTVVLAQAQSATAARPPAPRTDAQLVALFDYWQTEQAAGRMTRDQARAEAQSLSPGDQQRLRDAVTARDAAELAAAQEAARRSEEAARRSEEKARLAQEELRRANERARRILGNGASPSPDSSPSNGSSPRSGGSAPSGGASPSRGGAPRSSIIFDEPVSYHGGTPGMDINITGLATSAKYNPTNRPVTLAAIVSGLPKQALHMA